MKLVAVHFCDVCVYVGILSLWFLRNLMSIAGSGRGQTAARRDPVVPRVVSIE